MLSFRVSSLSTHTCCENLLLATGSKSEESWLKGEGLKQLVFMVNWGFHEATLVEYRNKKVVISIKCPHELMLRQTEVTVLSSLSGDKNSRKLWDTEEHRKWGLVWLIMLFHPSGVLPAKFLVQCNHGRAERQWTHKVSRDDVEAPGVWSGTLFLKPCPQILPVAVGERPQGFLLVLGDVISVSCQVQAGHKEALWGEKTEFLATDAHTYLISTVQTHLDVPGLCASPSKSWLHVLCAGWPTSKGREATAPDVSLQAGIHRRGWPGNPTPTDSARSAPIPVEDQRATLKSRCTRHFLYHKSPVQRDKLTFWGHSLEPNSFFRDQMNDSWHLSSIPSKWLQARITISFGWASSQAATDSSVSC